MGEHDQAVVEGRVELRRLDAGSRSEREAPVVVDDSGVAVPVHVLGDNPFELPTLRALLGARVRARGSWRNETLRVEPEAIDVISHEGHDDGEV